MMEALGKWLLSVSATALAVSVLQTLIPEGGIRRVATFTGGLLLLAVLLRPVLGADLEHLELDEQEKNYVTGSPSKGLEIVGYYEAGGHTSRIGDVLYTVSDNFDYWIMYNGRGTSGFLCIEPQAGKVNGLNIPDGYKVLAPCETVTYTTHYTHK